MPKRSLAPKTDLSRLFDKLFFCPSCTTWRFDQRAIAQTARSKQWIERRHASTWSSTTAINATKPIPPRLRPLHEALKLVQKKASAHVTTSRLQLALQGLEARRPTIRLAVLGVNVTDTARQVVRLLLADALEETGDWEEQLTKDSGDYGRGLIIRFGTSKKPDILRPINAIPVLHVPSPVLDRNNIEILVSSVSGPGRHGTLQIATTPAETFLSPVVGIPTSSDGRQTVTTQPVHRALVIARGLDEFITASQLLASASFVSNEDRGAVRLAVELPGSRPPSQGEAITLDIQQAAEGLAAIRLSNRNASDYAHRWSSSGVPEVTRWVESVSSRTSDDELPLSIQQLISSVLEIASSNLRSARIASTNAARDEALLGPTVAQLEWVVDNFSRSAHQELQSALQSAWGNRNWRKLVWYKLFWRVDDVELIVTDLITNAWLPQTERATYELAGRLIQVGIDPSVPQAEEFSTTPGVVVQSSIGTGTETVPQEAQLATAMMAGTSPTAASASLPSFSAPEPVEPVIVAPHGRTHIEMQPTTPLSIPISSLIPTARKTTISTSITRLTSTAQQLLLRTLSITGLTAGLSVLSYVSFFSSLYEAGTIAALGTVFALQRLQSGWARETRRFEDELFQRGREIIGDVVRATGELISTKSVITEDEVERKANEEAEEAVRKAQDEFARLRSVDGRAKDG